ncbi:hypothetical protein D3C87_1570090 [compost metagenome]
MNVDRLDRITAGRVEDVVMLREFDQLAKVFLIAGAATTLAIGNERGGSDLCEDQVIAADADIPLRISGMHGEA